jgi:large subunit ribosomal protein L24
MSKWIKKGDKVLVIAGNERGRSGTVLKRKGEKVVIQGMNIRKKHAKRREKVQTPSIIEMEMPIHISNVCLCDDEGKRIDAKVHANPKVGKGREKELFYMKGEKKVVLRTLKKS